MRDIRFPPTIQRLVLLAAVALGQFAVTWPFLDTWPEGALLPAAGVAFGLVLRLGPWSWPGVLAGAALAQLGTIPPAVAVGHATLLVLAPLLAARLLAAEGFDRCFDHHRDAGLLTAAAALTLLLPAVGGTTLLAAGGIVPWNAVLELAPRRWLGLVAGVMAVAPLLLTSDGGMRALLGRGRGVEFAAFLALTAFLGWALFGLRRGLPLTFLAFLPLGWAAMRFPRGGAGLAILAVALAATLGSVAGRGPFVITEPAPGPLLLAGFVITTSIGTLALSGLFAEGRRAREAAQASEERLRLALQSGGMGTWEWDLRTGKIEWSAGHSRLFGMEPAEFDGRLETFISRVHPDDLPALEAALERSRREWTPYASEFRVVWPDGSLRWMAGYGEALREQGVPVRVIGLVQDITEPKAAEAALRFNQLRLQGILNSARDGIITVDDGRRIVLFNRAAEEMFGIRGLAVLGEPLERFLRVPLPAPGGGPREERFEALEGARATGEAFPVEASVTRIEVEGRLLYTVTVRDLTERRASEEARRQLERQLRQAQRMDALGTLAGGIAHDFNNVLGAILGNVELARLDLPGDHPANQALVQITSASLRARDLVRGLLSFTRRHEPTRVPLRLQPVTEEVLRLLRASLPATVEFRAELDPDAPPALADASEIHQVLMNLCTNASHAMGPSGGVIDVGLERVVVDGVPGPEGHPNVEPGAYVRLSVSDTGSGIDAETLERIFDPFFTTKPPGEGTGLGLAVVHGIVQAHDGVITVQSEPGHGTRFRVYLPALDTVAPAPAPAPTFLPMGRGEHVLFLDDEPVLVVLGRRALERLGYRVTALADPAEAVARLRAAPEEFDLVVTDLTMPTLSGTEVAAAVQAVRPGLPVILTSGYGGEVARGAFGIRELMPKPTTLEQLATTVHRVLREAEAEAVPGNTAPEVGPASH